MKLSDFSMPASDSSGVLTLEDLTNFVESMYVNETSRPDYFIISVESMRRLRRFEALHDIYDNVCPRGMPRPGKVRKAILRRLQARIDKAKRRLARRERAEERYREAVRNGAPLKVRRIPLKAKIKLQPLETPMMDMMPRLQSNHGVYDFKSIQSIFNENEERQ